jgi:DMSO/TMAO reductase YedYZ molybdopterin-dependent catalytic subunit
MTDDTHTRLPPNQILTRKWPVLHYGTVPTVDLKRWRFMVRGAVERPFEIDWEELQSLPRRETACDIHCVTRWSRYDNVFSGVPVQDLLRRAGVRPEGRFVLVHAEQGFTTNLPLEDFDRPENLLALTHDGEPLSPELLEEDYPGFWEQNGYHMRGDPWAEERFGRPDPVRMRRGPR